MYSKKCAELCNDTPISIAFSPAGQHISIAFPTSIFLVDLESGTINTAQSFVAAGNDSIDSIFWLLAPFADGRGHLPNYLLAVELASGKTVMLAFSLFPVLLIPLSTSTPRTVRIQNAGEVLYCQAWHSIEARTTVTCDTATFSWPSKQLKTLTTLSSSYIHVKSSLAEMETLTSQWGKKFKDALKVQSDSYLATLLPFFHH